MIKQSVTSSDLHYFAALSRDSEDSTLTLSQLATYQSTGHLFCIEDNKKIVGFIAYRQILDEVDLDQILIDDLFRGRGLGTHALANWHEFLQQHGIKKSFLEVRETNTNAYMLYSKLGYEVVGRRKNYYQHSGVQIDALLMEKWL